MTRGMMQEKEKHEASGGSKTKGFGSRFRKKQHSTPSKKDPKKEGEIPIHFLALYVFFNILW